MMKLAVSSILLLLITQIKGNRLLQQSGCKVAPCLIPPCPVICPPDEVSCVGCDTCSSGSFFDGCNDCNCGPNGLAACTRKLCLTNSQPFCKPDCSATTCLSPLNCADGEIEVTPAGECCAQCKTVTDCSVVRCALPICEDNEIAITKPGECCKTCVPGICPPEEEPSCVGCDTCPNGSYNDGCNDCFCGKDGNVACTEKFCFAPGEPFCKPDCSATTCLSPLNCADGEIEVTPAGECCAQCKSVTDCRVVRCAAANCGDDEIAITRPGECCETCVPALCPTETCVGCNTCPNGFNDGCNDCKCDADGNVACTKKLCLVQGKPSCTPDCSATTCISFDSLICPKGQTKTFFPGKCCPGCVDEVDCTLTLCEVPQCNDDEIAAFIPGQCCQQCVPAVCPDSTPSPPVCDIEGQVFNTCGSACTATCDNPNPICTLQCVAKCECPSEAPILENGECITRAECKQCGNNGVRAKTPNGFRCECGRNRDCTFADGYKCKADPQCDNSGTNECAKYCYRKGQRCQIDDDCKKGYECIGGRCVDFE